MFCPSSHHSKLAHLAQSTLNQVKKMVVWQIPQNRTKLAAPVNISEESQETELSALPVS
jgi:hypothetical protein